MRLMAPAVRGTKWLAGSLVLGLATAGTLTAQQSSQEWLEQCQRNRGNRVNHCEVRESTVTSTGSFSVDARPNGGISVRSWDRPDVLVRARVQASAGDARRAQAIASEIDVSTRAGGTSSRGPRTGRNEGWSVSYEVFVPRTTNLSLTSVNGGISAQNLDGDVQATTTNGGITLRELSGEVRGSSTNGGINVHVAGHVRDGAGVDLRTTNGGVQVTIPAGRGANLEASTVNGGINSDIPLSVQGRIGRSVNAEINGGGPTVRLRTTNGGIRIRGG
jgi:DUF4097 and DUF4098 domain-containing protein YvlB